MSAEFQRDFAPADEDVGMMVRGLGELGDAIDEGDAVKVAGERKGAGDFFFIARARI